MTRILLASPMVLALSIGACGSSDDSTASPDLVVGSATAGDLTVTLRSTAALTTGLTPIYIALGDSAGNAVTDATLTIMPHMVGEMSHGAPVLTQPQLDENSLYRAEVVFEMASSDMDSWAATVGITRPDADAVEAEVASLVVTDSGRAKVFTYTDPATTTTTEYVVSLNLDAEPTVGLNDVTVTLHRMDSMMDFSPVDDAGLTLTPEMPAMGHGSPGSVAPTLVSPGRYAGRLSFSMAGAWETTLGITVEDVVIGSPVFATSF